MLLGFPLIKELLGSENTQGYSTRIQLKASKEITNLLEPPYKVCTFGL